MILYWNSDVGILYWKIKIFIDALWLSSKLEKRRNDCTNQTMKNTVKNYKFWKLKNKTCSIFVVQCLPYKNTTQINLSKRTKTKTIWKNKDYYSEWPAVPTQLGKNELSQ